MRRSFFLKLSGVTAAAAVVVALSAGSAAANPVNCELLGSPSHPDFGFCDITAHNGGVFEFSNNGANAFQACIDVVDPSGQADFEAGLLYTHDAISNYNALGGGLGLFTPDSSTHGGVVTVINPPLNIHSVPGIPGCEEFGGAG